MEIPDDQVGSNATWPRPSPVPDSCRSAAEGRRLRSTDSLFHRLWELCRNETHSVKTDVCDNQASWAFLHLDIIIVIKDTKIVINIIIDKTIDVQCNCSAGGVFNIITFCTELGQ